MKWLRWIKIKWRSLKNRQACTRVSVYMLERVGGKKIKSFPLGDARPEYISYHRTRAIIKSGSPVSRRTSRAAVPPGCNLTPSTANRSANKYFGAHLVPAVYFVTLLK